MGVHGNMLERAYINMLEKFCNIEIQSNMLAKNRNIGHWWRFSGFFNMPNGAFFGRKVLRFYVRFLALFWRFLSWLFPAFCVIRATPNAGRANLGTPDAGKQEWQNFTSVKPAQPMKLILPLNLNAKKSDPILQAA